jgi:hypothetical protein
VRRRALECTVRAGEMLYLPSAWWHEVTSEAEGGRSLSLNFWFRAEWPSSTLRRPHAEGAVHATAHTSPTGRFHAHITRPPAGGVVFGGLQLAGVRFDWARGLPEVWAGMASAGMASQHGRRHQRVHGMHIDAHLPKAGGTSRSRLRRLSLRCAPPPTAKWGSTSRR